ncbi:carbohydrate kinase [Geojedonia litorea]|uniref:Carbohydrate kinase n=1 Tax=Geojedonia litorea TaxID=1268269 RepID=A0ABV9N6A7_9FLAO
MYTFTCFGEVLWDVFPDREKIGGAPLNVSMRLNAFGNDVAIISAVGNDDLGEKLITYLKEQGLTTQYIQIKNDYETGKVNVSLDASGSASYDIKFPVAWDFIELDSTIQLVKRSRVFIFGSLACRNSNSRNTLFELLEHANFKVFDVNLRAPHYNFELLSRLMNKANFIKFNDDELELIVKSFGQECETLEDQIKFIYKKFSTSHICVTRGGKGAVLFINDKFYFNEGFEVKVKDTVGAGDSFLGTLLHKLNANFSPQKALNYACAVGALVASAEGANPVIHETDIVKLMQ